MIIKAAQEMTAWALGRWRILWIRALLSGCSRSFISSNCIGSRISILTKSPYLSPTVNLWFEPEDYLAFVEHLDAYRALDGAFREDRETSARLGYPVGLIGGGDLPEIRVYFMHYRTLDEAVETWRRRFERVRHDRISLTFADREGATLHHLRRFDALPYPKLCFVHIPRPEIKSAVYVRGFERDGEVGDLFAAWGRLAEVLTTPRIAKLAGGRARHRTLPTLNHRGCAVD